MTPDRERRIAEAREVIDSVLDGLSALGELLSAEGVEVNVRAGETVITRDAGKAICDNVLRARGDLHFTQVGASSYLKPGESRSFHVHAAKHLIVEEYVDSL